MRRVPRAYGAFDPGVDSCRARDCAVYTTANPNTIAIPIKMNMSRRRIAFMAFHDG